MGIGLIPELKEGESVLGLGRARPWVGSSGGRRGLDGRTRGGRGQARIPRWTAQVVSRQLSAVLDLLGVAALPPETVARRLGT